MCGIVGYVGEKDAVPILMDGLKRLEYRGYDSAGIGVIHDGRLEIRRTAGKIADLARVLLQEPLRGRPGVGHTRWATHGKPSDRNAHPHSDCARAVAVVHNGIIENSSRLRKSLEADGHQFESETDTEVVAHLLEEFTDGDVEVATTRAVAELTGAYALGIISERAPGQLLAVRKGAAPLVVAAGEDGLFIASDIWSGVTSRKRSSCASSDTCGAGGAFGGRSAARSTGCTGALIGGSAPTGTGLSGGSSGERRGAPGG